MRRRRLRLCWIRVVRVELDPSAAVPSRASRRRRFPPRDAPARRRRHQTTASVVAADARNAPRTRADDVGPGAVGPRMEEDDDAAPGRLEGSSAPDGEGEEEEEERRDGDRDEDPGDAPAAPPRYHRFPGCARRPVLGALEKISIVSAPAARGRKFDPGRMEPPDGAAHRPAAGMPPRIATGRRRRWLLAAGVGCVHVDPGASRPIPRRRPLHPRPDTRRHRPNRSPDSPAAHPLPPQVRRRAGRVRRGGRTRRHRRGPRVHRPVAPSEEEEGGEGSEPRRRRRRGRGRRSLRPTDPGARALDGERRRPADAHRRKERCSRPPPPPPRRPRRRARPARRPGGAHPPRGWRDRLTGRPRSNSTRRRRRGVRRGPGRDVRPDPARVHRGERALFDPAAGADSAKMVPAEPPPGVGVLARGIHQARASRGEHPAGGAHAGGTTQMAGGGGGAGGDASDARGRVLQRLARRLLPPCFSCPSGRTRWRIRLAKMGKSLVAAPSGSTGSTTRRRRRCTTRCAGRWTYAPDGDASNRNGSRDNER